MPTGYTAKLMEQGQSFEDFVMLCARAMGACIMMRDDPLDAPIPEKFEPSDYYLKRIAEARSELKMLRRMSKQEQIEFGKRAKRDRVAHLEQNQSKGKPKYCRLMEMLVAVEAWNPPTEDHAGLKKFMLEQIETSKPYLDYWERELSSALEMPEMGYFQIALEKAKRDIEYHTREHAAEVARARARTAWIKQLRRSLKGGAK